MTITKPFFWENEANVETFQKLSAYIWVSYMFVLKSGETSKLIGIIAFSNVLNVEYSTGDNVTKTVHSILEFSFNKTFDSNTSFFRKLCDKIWSLCFEF